MLQFLQAGRNREARILLKSLPKSPATLALWGKYSLLQGDLQEAVSSYRQSLILSDSTANSITLAYLLLLLSEKRAEASTDLRQEAKNLLLRSLSRIDRNSPLDEARAYLYLGKIESKYLEIAKRKIYAWSNERIKAIYLINLFDISADRAVLFKALESVADSRLRSYIYYKLGEFDKAISLAESESLGDLSWMYLFSKALSLPHSIERESYLNAAAKTLSLTRRSSLSYFAFPEMFGAGLSPKSVYEQLAIDYLESGRNASERVDKALEALRMLKSQSLLQLFVDDCFERSLPSAHLPSGSAKINTLVGEKKTYIILEKGNVKKIFKVAISKDEIQNLVRQFREQLQDVATEDYLKTSQTLYDLLIRPLEPDLQDISYLIYDNNSSLANFPLAALYDGRKFLIESLPLVYASGLQAQSAKKKGGSGVFLGAVPNPPAPWTSLPYTKTEVRTVAEILGVSYSSNTKASDLKSSLTSSKVGTVHIASHIKLRQNLVDSEIVLSDRVLGMEDFESYLQNRPTSLDLLILSGCDTAVGDSRWVLGLAGLALKNDVRQVVASLWSINDADTARLIELFYQYRSAGMAEYQALQKAQVSLIRDIQSYTPASWASFVYIRN